jgi:hypothetical protein
MASNFRSRVTLLPQPYGILPQGVQPNVGVREESVTMSDLDLTLGLLRCRTIQRTQGEGIC